MALYTEEAIYGLLKTKAHGKGALNPDKYTGLYYEEPETGKRKYIVIAKQAGNVEGTTRSPRQERRVARKNKGWHPEAKKVEAATLHVAVGNLQRVSELTKVSIHTLRKWTDEPWWYSTQQRVKREAVEETDAKFTKLIDKAINKLEKAVEEGDYIYDIKKGTLVKIPMTGRDLAIVAGTTFDKRQLLRGEATKITKAPDTEKHLEDLAKRFAALVQDKMKPKEIEVQGEVLENEATQQ